MIGKKVLGIGVLAMITGLFAGFDARAASPARDVLVVPARSRIVALAFDVSALRDVAMISYRGTAATDSPLLHYWDAKSRQWRELSAEEFAFGSFMASQPRNLYLVGTGRDVPPSVLAGTSQARNVVRIETFAPGEIVNTLDQTLKFKQAEWTALAQRHGFAIRDVNYERRRWGRYGPPSAPRTPPPPATEFDVDFTEAPSITEGEPGGTADIKIEDIQAAAEPAGSPEADIVELESLLGVMDIKPLAPEAPPAPAVTETPAKPRDHRQIEEKGLPLSSPAPIPEEPLPEDK